VIAVRIVKQTRRARGQSWDPRNLADRNRVVALSLTDRYSDFGGGGCHGRRNRRPAARLVHGVAKWLRGFVIRRGISRRRQFGIGKRFIDFPPLHGNGRDFHLTMLGRVGILRRGFESAEPVPQGLAWHAPLTKL
jgi:hypothetical protein